MSDTTSALQWSAEILQEIFRHTPVGVVLTDLHGTILEANDAVCGIVGYPREQIVGRSASSFMHPDDVTKVNEQLSRFRADGQGSRKGDCRLVARSGQMVFASITVSVIRSADNAPTLGIAFIEDIGDRLRMESALRDSAVRYRQVVEDQTEMIVRWTPDGTRTFVNDAYARYFGIAESELIGTSFFPLVPEEDRAALAIKIRGLTPEAPTANAVHRMILADGSLRWTEWTDRASFDEAGRITIVQSIGRDVTDRVKATEALRLSESRHRRLFEHLPIAAWEVEWGGVVAYVRALGVRSADELLRLATDNPEVFRAALSHLRVCEVNAAALLLGGVNNREDFVKWITNIAAFGSSEQVIRGAAPILFEDTDSNYVEMVVRDTNESPHDLLFQWTRIRQSETGWRIITNVLDLTEQKRNERELLDQKLRLEQAEGLTHLGNWEIDVATSTCSGSAEYWKIYDGTAGGPRTRPADRELQRVHPDDRASVDAHFVAMLAAPATSFPETPSQFEFRIVRADGSVRWIRSVATVRHRDGMPPLIYGADQDITDRKESEEALLRNESLYRHLFRSLPVAVWETDWSGVIEELRQHGIETADQLLEALEKNPDTVAPIIARRRPVEANQNALDLFGVADLAPIMKATWPPKLAPEQTAMFVRTLLSVAFGKTRMARLDLQVGRPDGTFVDVDAMLSCSDAAPGHVITTAIDVTERKQIERELIQSQMQLERAQSIAHLGSWEMNLERNEMVGSAEYWRMMDGADGGPRIRTISDAMAKIHPDDRNGVWSAIVKAHDDFISGRAVDETSGLFRVVLPDGSIRTLRGQGMFMRTPAGEVRGYGVQHDITDIIRAEQNARQQREELTRADRMISLGILVSGVAHEINNPNQFIILNAPFLRSAWSDVEPIIDAYAAGHPDLRVNGMRWPDIKNDIPEIISEIDRGADRIRLIVSELRGFARDQAVTDLRLCDLNQVIEGSLRLLSSHIRRATTKFSTHLAANLPMVRANPQRLEQVVVNLVMNSCQALERTNAAIRVETVFDEATDCVLMRVIDEGRGIPSENLKNIRDPFFTTKRTEGGMGLGLAVSDRIVQEHHGSLWFESEPGRGTTATLTLPAASDEIP